MRGVAVNTRSNHAHALQTFQDDLLALCGRGHDLADVFRAVEAVHAAGVPNWSLDLMSGLPQVGASQGLLLRLLLLLLLRLLMVPPGLLP